jgi:hypothetical protein
MSDGVLITKMVSIVLRGRKTRIRQENWIRTCSVGRKTRIRKKTASVGSKDLRTAEV